MDNKTNIVGESSIMLYTNSDNTIQLEVKLEQETVWLTQKQMAALFDVKTPAINKHLKHIFEDGELQEIEVVSKMEITTQHGAIAGKVQHVETKFYNLDAILSVGYRVNSKNAIAFRHWASNVLKDYIVKGYAVRDQLQLQHYNDLKNIVSLMSRTMALQEQPKGDEYSGLFNVISDYVYALDTLDHYDYQELTIQKTTREEPFRATYENAMDAIRRLKEKFGGSALFANEKDDSFKSSIGQIYQTFAGEELYPSVEEKAAMLLYLVTKNHSFSDGNKRIAAMLFLWFMEKNGILYASDGRKRIADNTLVALTLMIAESRTEEKDIMVKVVVNLINQDNWPSLLRSLGWQVNNDMFAKHAWYFRNALVRANYHNVQKGIDYTFTYLERFFRNLLLGETWDLRSRYLHIAAPEEWRVQPNLSKKTSVQIVKTSEKKQKTSVQIVKLLRDNPTYTAETIAKLLGKTTRAIEMQLAKLSQQQIISHNGPNKGGRWIVKE